MPTLRATNGMVAASEEAATEIGIRVMRDGGNAVDAAVAAALAISVVDPGDSGIGGGGFATIYLDSLDEFLVVDFNSTCPSGIADSPYEPLDRLSDYTGYVAVRGDENIYGYKSISVPGTPAGYELLLSKYGTKKPEELIQSSIDLARKGFGISRFVANYLDAKFDKMAGYDETLKTFAPRGPPAVGSRLSLREYAATLERLKKDGLGSFYHGKIASSIAEAAERNGGLLTSEDLSRYVARVVQPSVSRYRRFEIQAPPVASGGTAVQQMLGILENFELGKLGQYSAEALHVMIEAMKLTWADRLAFEADPEYEEVPMNEMLSKRYCAERASMINMHKTITAAAPGDPWKYQKKGRQIPRPLGGNGDHTTHVTTVDKERNFVALTQTLWGLFGSLVTVPGTGIVMNNGQSRFDPDPKSSNRPEPGKRVLSNMSPLMASRDGAPILAAGTPGSKRVVTTMLIFVVNVVDYGMKSDALDMPRFHCERGEPVIVEPLWIDRMPIGAARRLEKLGHRLTMVSPSGGTIPGFPYISGPASAIMVDKKGLNGTADSRQPGSISGY